MPGASGGGAAGSGGAPGDAAAAGEGCDEAEGVGEGCDDARPASASESRTAAKAARRAIGSGRCTPAC